jgi:hypothetical protein
MRGNCCACSAKTIITAIMPERNFFIWYFLSE